MELAGEVMIGVPPQQVWAGLNDPDVLRQCIPGCEEVRQITPTETHTRVLLKMGPVRARFVGKIFMSDVRPGEGCTLAFEGSGGAAGFARGSSVVKLVPEGDATRLHYSASASIGGKLGQIGGRMIDASAKQMADQFFNAFRAQLDGSVPGAAQAASNAASHATGASTASSASHAHSTASLAHSTALPAASVTSEYVRVLWFVLGMASTGFGVWLAGHLGR
ncbi:MAG: carbon monoxide dehydrogenase subunit G [Herminiimonas sp.]|nr:carbon monoxide dehydrogenase subunit G [Herminiimonas sp.]